MLNVPHRTPLSNSSLILQPLPPVTLAGCSTGSISLRQSLCIQRRIDKPAPAMLLDIHCPTPPNMLRIPPPAILTTLDQPLDPPLTNSGWRRVIGMLFFLATPVEALLTPVEAPLNVPFHMDLHTLLLPCQEAVGGHPVTAAILAAKEVPAGLSNILIVRPFPLCRFRRDQGGARPIPKGISANILLTMSA